MKQTIQAFAFLGVIALGWILLPQSTDQTPYSVQPDSYLLGSRGDAEIRKVSKKENGLSIFCDSPNQFQLDNIAGSYAREGITDYINQLPQKKLAVLTLSKVFMTKPKKSVTEIAKKEAQWLQYLGFQRVFIQGAQSGFVLILLHDTDYVSYPERVLKNGHDTLSALPSMLPSKDF